jgi:hypothetical protein
VFAEVAMVEIWIRTNEAEDVAGSIRHAIRAANFVSEDPQAWKWVALALHSALQGACICHLTTTFAPLGAVTDRNASEWVAYIEDQRTDPDAKPPKTNLMALPDLLKAVRKPNSAGDSSNNPGVGMSDSELNWLCSFHKTIRNEFVHFEPKQWSIEVSGIPELAKLIARIIEDILEQGWAFRHQDSAWREETRQNLQTLASLAWPKP